MSKAGTLPHVDFGKAKVKKGVKVGAPGKLQWIAIADLRIDPTYQRDVGAKGVANIRKIVENFAWHKFSPLVVAERDGHYAIIDGQHRAIAAKLHGGMRTLPCLVIRVSEREEAEAFATINGQVTRLHTQTMFKAKVAAADPAALAAEKCAVAAGVKILAYPLDAARLGKNETLACGEIERLCTFYGPKLTTATLRVMLRAAKGQPGLLRAVVIRAVCSVLFENPDWVGRIDDVGDAIGAAGIPKLMERAAASSGFQADRRTLASRLVVLIVETVSKRIEKAAA